MSKMYTFSGMDGAGKTTYIHETCEYLAKNGYKSRIVWSRGGYTAVFEWLKRIARKTAGKNMPPSGHSQQRSELLTGSKIGSMWYILAVLDLIRLYSVHFRLCALSKKVLLCDRYLYDTYVDFAIAFGAKKIDNSKLWRFLVKTARTPERSFLLFVTAEESYVRSVANNDPFCETYAQKVVRCDYYTALKNRGCWDVICDTVTNSIENVCNLLRHEIKL